MVSTRALILAVILVLIYDVIKNKILGDKGVIGKGVGNRILDIIVSSIVILTVGKGLDITLLHDNTIKLSIIQYIMVCTPIIVFGVLVQQIKSLKYAIDNLGISFIIAYIITVIISLLS